MLQVNQSHEKSEDAFFENLQNEMKLADVSRIYKIPRATIYDWRYRRVEKQIPKELFVKRRNRVFIRTDVLRHWMATQSTI